MSLVTLLKEKNLSQYQLAKLAHVSKSTVSELCSNTLSIDKCNAGTIYRIAKVLQVSMEDLLEPYCEYRCSFELFKSQTCHRLKEMGDLHFLMQILSKDEISFYAKREWYPESLYLLAMVDYVSKINHIDLCTKYDYLRSAKLPELLYPSGVLSICAIEKSDRAKKEAYNNSISEFLRHNIVEVEIREVV